MTGPGPMLNNTEDQLKAATAATVTLGQRITELTKRARENNAELRSLISDQTFMTSVQRRFAQAGSSIQANKYRIGVMLLGAALGGGIAVANGATWATVAVASSMSGPGAYATARFSTALAMFIQNSSFSTRLMAGYDSVKTLASDFLSKVQAKTGLFNPFSAAINAVKNLAQSLRAKPASKSAEPLVVEGEPNSGTGLVNMDSLVGGKTVLPGKAAADTKATVAASNDNNAGAAIANEGVKTRSKNKA